MNSQHASPPATLGDQLVLFARDIKISHTVFAMPWALLSTFLAARGCPKAIDLVLILLCMVTARTVAMAANRLLDATLDAKNPRTAGRAIPSGKLSRKFYLLITAGCCIGFIAATALFWIVDRNIWPIVLSIPVLLFLAAYPLLKRFTRLVHYYLGAALGLAPICAWIAIRPQLSVVPFLIALAVLLWTAGFDILYACQDYQSDLETGVVSIPSRFGIAKALWIARFTHLVSFSTMVLIGVLSPELSTLFFLGVACAGVLLIVEHLLVRADDLSKISLAFFTMNGIISLLIGSLGIIDVLRSGSRLL